MTPYECKIVAESQSHCVIVASYEITYKTCVCVVMETSVVMTSLVREEVMMMRRPSAERVASRGPGTRANSQVSLAHHVAIEYKWLKESLC